MRIDRLYYIVSTVTVALGMLTFAAASGSAITGLILLLSMGAALILTTGEHARAVPKWFTSVLAVGAMVYAIGAIIGANPTEMVLHVARTVAALQIVKILEPRTPRNQAQLLALSGMLTVGSCLTNVGFRMAVGLGLYAPLMLASVMLFQLYSAERRAHPNARPEDRARTGRASLAGVRAVGIATALGIAGVATGAFLIMPRGLLDDTGAATPGLNRDVSGFTDHVRLGGEGIITDSEAVVLDIRIFEYNAGRPAPRRPGSDDWKPAIVEVLYLRGAVLDDYEPQRGIWTRTNAIAERDDRNYQNPSYLRPLFRAPKESREHQTFVQMITVRSRPSDHLFALARPAPGKIVFDQNIDEFTFNPIDRTFSLPERRGLFSYTVCSEPGDDMSPATPASFPVPEVRDYALEVLEERGLRRDASLPWTPEDRNIIGVFERHLRNNPEFTYSREMFPPPPGQDPIVEFLRVTRVGHCEYYASALAALCKSVGIHARVITGYAVSEYNPQDGSYTVRESNAHAWVEAMTQPGYWETFDASPAEEVRYGRPGPAGLRGMWINLNESVRFAWLKWVVGFNEHDQTTIFRLEEGGPLGIFNRIKAAARSTGVIERDNLPRLTPQRMARAALHGLIAFAGTLGMLYALHWLLVRTGVIARVMPKRRVRKRYDRSVYGLMLRALDRADLTKPDSIPPMAYAMDLERIDPAIAADVRAISGSYYASRFGGRQTGEHEAASRLSALKQRLSDRR